MRFLAPRKAYTRLEVTAERTAKLVVVSSSPASSILTRVGREVLGQLGLRQKARSRLWIDDRRWWLIVVEFQPSSWSQGSYLNVSGMWLWKRSDHYHYDTPDTRLHEHVEYHDHAQFEPAARQLAELAAARIEELREQFPSLEAVAEQLLPMSLSRGVWHEYHAGVAAGLTGGVSRARTCFEVIEASAQPDNPDWHRNLCRLAGELRDRCSDGVAFRGWASGVVAESRRLLGLDALPTPAFG